MANTATNTNSGQAQYIYPSPAGAYSAGTGKHSDGEQGQQLLLRLMAQDNAPEESPQTVAALFQLPEQEAMAQYQKLHRLRILQTLPEPFQAENQALEVNLPILLAQLSDNQQSLIADDQGFYLASNALDPGKAEQLAGFTVEFSQLRDRYQDLLIGDEKSAWAFGGARDYNNFGFWELLVGSNRLFLVIGGRPNLNQQAMVELVWHIVHRYGTGREGAAVTNGGSPFSFGRR